MSFNYIYEAIFLNNENVEFKEKANELILCNEKTNETKKITINELFGQTEIEKEMTEHLLVRQKYLNITRKKHRNIFPGT